MPRARTGVVRRRKHNKIRKMVKGQWGTRGRLFKRSNEAMLKSLFYAYRDRRTRKREFRALWIQRINAAARMHGMTYSQMMGGLIKAGIEIDRKMLADLAVNEPTAFAALVEQSRAAA